MTRALAVLLALAGCDSDDSGQPRDAAPDMPALPDAPPYDVMVDSVPPDAPPMNAGFVPPTAAIEAWTETAENTYEAATLDLSCLGMARNDPPTTGVVMLTVTVRDFQSANVVPNAGVNVFDMGGTIGTATTDSNGNVQFNIPAGNTRLRFRSTATSARPTTVIDRLLAPSTASQAMTIESLSNSTATTLPALIGQTPAAGTALQLGTMRDCQGHTLSNLIATISTMPDTAVHLAGIETFYFSDSVGLPVRHSQQATTSKDGRFMVIDIPMTATAYVQVWGYRNSAELATQTLTLIAQRTVGIAASSALFTDHDPRATP